MVLKILRAVNHEWHCRIRKEQVLFLSISTAVFFLAANLPASASDAAPISVFIHKDKAQELKVREDWILVPREMRPQIPQTDFILWNAWWRTWIVDEHFGFGVTPLQLLEPVAGYSRSNQDDKWKPISKAERRAKKMKYIERSKAKVEDALDETHAQFLSSGVRFSWASYLYFREWNSEFKGKHHLYPKVKVPLSWKSVGKTPSLSDVQGELSYRQRFEDFPSLVHELAGTHSLKRIDYWLLWKRFDEIGSVKHTVLKPLRRIPVLKQVDEFTPVEKLDNWFSNSVYEANLNALPAADS